MYYYIKNSCLYIYISHTGKSYRVRCEFNEPMFIIEGIGWQKHEMIEILKKYHSGLVRD